MLGIFAFMTEHLEMKILEALWKLGHRQSSLDDFRGWFVPVSCNFEPSSKHPLATDWVHWIDGVLAEASSGGWSEEEILQELTAPFVPKFAENSVGDPRPKQTSESNARFSLNVAA